MKAVAKVVLFVRPADARGQADGKRRTPPCDREAMGVVVTWRVGGFSLI